MLVSCHIDSRWRDTCSNPATKLRCGARSVETVPPLPGSGAIFPPYPGLNHPNPRKSGACRGPRLRRWFPDTSFHCGSRKKALGQGAPQGLKPGLISGIYGRPETRPLQRSRVNQNFPSVVSRNFALQLPSTVLRRASSPQRLKRLLKNSAMKICRRLKPAPDKLNKRLIGTTEVVP